MNQLCSGHIGIIHNSVLKATEAWCEIENVFLLSSIGFCDLFRLECVGSNSDGRSAPTNVDVALNICMEAGETCHCLS